MIRERKIFYVDSSKRLSGNNSDFTYLIEMSGVNYQYAVVLQANIPKSYYLVESGYNTITLQEGELLIEINVPAGNYTRQSLKTTLMNILNNSSALGYIYKIEIPKASEPDDGKYTFKVYDDMDEKINVDVKLIFKDYLYEALGFDRNSTNVFINYKLKSTNVVKLQIEDSVYVHSDICTNGNDNILQEIFTISSPDYGNIVFQTPSFEAYSKRVIHNQSNTFRFYLTDEKDQPIELNGLNCILTLLLYNTN